MKMETKKWRVITSATDAQPKIRMSFEMRDALKQIAVSNGRTFNNEVLVRLANSLYAEENYLTRRGQN